MDTAERRDEGTEPRRETGEPQSNAPIAVLGAGLIGCYLGGRLLAHGHKVTLIGRPSLRDELSEHGLTVTDWQGYRGFVEPADVKVETRPEALRDAEVILLTVKNRDTPSATQQIAENTDADTLVVSFQNGVRNADIIRQHLPNHDVRAGMVPFNVIKRASGHYHCATEGTLVIEQSNDADLPLVAALTGAGLTAVRSPQIKQILWSKLLMNLNNPINALAGIPLVEELRQQGYRKVLAASMREGLLVLKRAGIKPVRVVGKVSPSWIPFMLSLPDWIFVRLAGAMLNIDPNARSSMWEDLEKHRQTEIDYLNGEIVTLAEAHNVDVPVNRKVISLIKEAERSGKGSPGLSAEQLWNTVRATSMAASKG